LGYIVWLNGRHVIVQACDLLRAQLDTVGCRVLREAASSSLPGAAR